MDGRRLIIMIGLVLGIGINSAMAQPGAELELVTPRVFYQVARFDELPQPLDGVIEGVGNIAHAGMSLDGETIAWASVIRDEGTTVYLANWEGTRVDSAAIPDRLTPWEMEVGRNCAALLMNDGSLWRVEGGTATKLFGGNRQVNRAGTLEATQDCYSITFLAVGGEYAGDLVAIHGIGEPLRVMEREILPCPNLLGCQDVWNILDWEEAAEAERGLVLTDGFWVKNEAGDVITLTEYEIQVGTTQTWWYITSDKPLGPVMGYPEISPDGSHIVFSAELFDGETSLGYWWIWADANGGLWIALQPQQFNKSDAAMNRDGSMVFLDLGLIEYPEPGRTQGLFPAWNVRSVYLTSNSHLAMSCQETACRLLFGDAAAILYRGYYDDWEAWEQAPIQIDDVTWTESDTPGWYVLTVDTRGSNIVPTIVTADPIGSGVVLEWESIEYRCPFGPLDNGQSPDVEAGDGIFTAACVTGPGVGNGLQDGFRVAASQDRRQGVVAVGDYLLPRGE